MKHTVRTSRASRRGKRAGMSLLETLVSTAILAMMSLMIYSAFEHTGRMRARLSARLERDHVARIALARISRDIRGSFISAHVNPNPTAAVVLSAFVARDETRGDRLDLTAFTHRRLLRNSHEGDACEVGYRVETRREDGRTRDLLRRESPRIDNDPLRGGTVDVLVPGITDFQLRYFDPTQDRWQDDWDTTSASAQPVRLPSRVRITLTITEQDGERSRERQYVTEAAPMMTEALRFGLPLDFR